MAIHDRVGRSPVDRVVVPMGAGMTEEEKTARAHVNGYPARSEEGPRCLPRRKKTGPMEQQGPSGARRSASQLGRPNGDRLQAWQQPRPCTGTRADRKRWTRTFLPTSVRRRLRFRRKNLPILDKRRNEPVFAHRPKQGPCSSRALGASLRLIHDLPHQRP